MLNKNYYRQRTTIFTVLALMYILVYFYRVSLAVVAGDVSRELQLTPQQLGALSGILFYVYAVAQLPLGPMIDRLGSRVVISASGLLTACGAILFSQSHSLAMAMTARILIGIGTASVLMATFTIFSHWYTKQEFGRVSGFMVAIGNLGNLSATAPLALAVAAIGWRSSFLVTGLAQVVATLLVFGLVRDYPLLAGEAEAKAPVKQQTGMLEAWKTIFSNKDFLLLGMISFFWYGNYLALQGLWGGPYLMEVKQLTRSETGQMLMLTSIGFIIGSTVIDKVARTLFHSYKKTLLAGQLLLVLCVALFLGPADLITRPLLAACFLVIGLAVSSGVMIYPIIRSMFPVEIVGTALTSLNFFVLMGAAATQQIMGIIISHYPRSAEHLQPQAFHGAFLFPVIGLACAIVAFSRARDYGQ